MFESLRPLDKILCLFAMWIWGRLAQHNFHPPQCYRRGKSIKETQIFNVPSWKSNFRICKLFLQLKEDEIQDTIRLQNFCNDFSTFSHIIHKAKISCCSSLVFYRFLMLSISSHTNNRVFGWEKMWKYCMMCATGIFLFSILVEWKSGKIFEFLVSIFIALKNICVKKCLSSTSNNFLGTAKPEYDI